jgi:hypothetical protein
VCCKRGGPRDKVSPDWSTTYRGAATADAARRGPVLVRRRNGAASMLTIDTSEVCNPPRGIVGYSVLCAAWRFFIISNHSIDPGCGGDFGFRSSRSSEASIASRWCMFRGKRLSCSVWQK